MTPITIHAAHAGSLEITAALVADVRSVRSNIISFAPSMLVAPMSQDRVLIASYADQRCWTVDVEGVVVELAARTQEAREVAKDALANARQLLRYHEGRVVPLTFSTDSAAMHASVRAGVAGLRYRQALSYLAYMFAGILEDTWEGQKPHSFL